jgi:hypothetical protein
MSRHLPICCVVFASLGCVTHPEATCEKQSDCDSHGVCSSAGFCESECAGSGDCPCGSFCAEGCNLCVRDDLSGPATCFAFNRGLAVAEVLGACRSGLGDARAVASVCQLDPVTPGDCTLNAHGDSGGASPPVPAGGPDASIAGLPPQSDAGSGVKSADNSDGESVDGGDEGGEE